MSKLQQKEIQMVEDKRGMTLLTDLENIQKIYKDKLIGEKDEAKILLLLDIDLELQSVIGFVKKYNENS